LHIDRKEVGNEFINQIKINQKCYNNREHTFAFKYKNKFQVIIKQKIQR